MEIAYFYNENWTNFLLFYQKNAILSTTIKCMWHICYTAILEELFRFEQLSNKYTDKKISVQSNTSIISKGINPTQVIIESLN